MAEPKVETPHAGGFIIREANGYRSRDQIVIASGQGVLEAGTVLASAGGGKFGKYNNDATASTATGVLFARVDATDADAAGVAIVRDCEVNQTELVFESTEDTADVTAALADLKALGIICRDGDDPLDPI